MSAICRTCEHWCEGGPRISDAVRDPSLGPDRGTCQAYPPDVFIVLGAPTSYWPVTHADRTCGQWSPCAPADDGDPDGGEEVNGNVVPFGKAVAA